MDTAPATAALPTLTEFASDASAIQELAVLFKQPQGMEAILAKIEEEARSQVLDVSSKKGREAIASLAHKIARSKTALDEAGKGLNDAVRAQIETVDAERRKIRNRLDALKAEIRAPLDEWEAAEAARKRYLEQKLETLRLAASGHIASAKATSVEIAVRAAEVNDIRIDDSWEEYHQKAMLFKRQAEVTLADLMDHALLREAQTAELARLQAAEREAAAEKAAQTEALRRAQAEEQAARDAAERSEANVRAEAAKAERAALAREEALRLELAEERSRAVRAELEAREVAERREAEIRFEAECAEREAREREEAAAAAERAKERMLTQRAKIEREITMSIAQILSALDPEPSSLFNVPAEVLAKALMKGEIAHCRVEVQS